MFCIHGDLLLNDNKLFYLAKYFLMLQMWKLMGKILKPFLKRFLEYKDI